MNCENTMVVDRIAKAHDGRPEELLMKMAAKALKAVDVICEVCQGKIDVSLENRQEI